MASGFVPGGTINRPIERDDEWLRAELELEEERKRKAELGKQQDGKSLYDVLQENKGSFLVLSSNSLKKPELIWK